MNFKAFFLFTLSCLAVITSMTGQSEWTLKKEVDGIKVYYREAADSPIKELKITFDVNTSLSGFMAAITDTEAYTKWIYKLSHAEVLDYISPSEIVYYYEMDFPWPLSDRDGITKTYFRQDPNSKVIYASNSIVEGYLPPKPGIVRLEITSVDWILTPVANQKISVEYYLSSDPGGSIPAWLVNWALDRGPVKSIKALKSMAEGEKYRLAQLAHVENAE